LKKRCCRSTDGFKRGIKAVEAIAADLKEASKLAFDLTLIKSNKSFYFANNEVIGESLLSPKLEKKE
jgi:hypothetical protein